MWDIKSPSQIWNLIKDIKVLVKNVEIINFMYYSRSTNNLADKITKGLI